MDYFSCYTDQFITLSTVETSVKYLILDCDLLGHLQYNFAVSIA